MDCGNVDATLCHHISRHGAVDSAGKQEHSFARSAHRYSTCGRSVSCVNICICVSYLNIYRNIGIFYIDFKAGKSVKNASAKLCAYFRRSHWKTLVGALCLHLECACAGKLVTAVFHNVTGNYVKILLGYHRTAYCGSTEHL